MGHIFAQSDYEYKWWGDRSTKLIANSAQTIADTIEYVFLDTSASGFPLTLPLVIDSLDVAEQVVITRKLIIIGDATLGSSNVTLLPNGTGITIELNSSFVMDKNNQVLKLELLGDQWVIKGNTSNELVAASVGFTGGVTPTVLADTSTFVKIGGTYVEGGLFAFSNFSGTLAYEGGNPSLKTVTGAVELLLEPSVEGDQIEVSLFVGDVEVTTSRKQHTLDAVFQTPTSPLFYVQEAILFDSLDDIEVRMRNVSNATNVTATDVKLVVGK